MGQEDPGRDMGIERRKQNSGIGYHTIEDKRRDEIIMKFWRIMGFLLRRLD